MCGYKIQSIHACYISLLCMLVMQPHELSFIRECLSFSSTFVFKNNSYGAIYSLSNGMY